MYLPRNDKVTRHDKIRREPTSSLDSNSYGLRFTGYVLRYEELKMKKNTIYFYVVVHSFVRPL